MNASFYNMYRIYNYLNGIDEIKVIKETEDFVITKDKIKIKKQCKSNACFKTKIECIQWRIDKFDNEIKRLNKQIKYVIKQKKKFVDSIKEIKISE